ncbi:hypothetical protein Tco_0680020 [Tanacetum coccineum]|uniref:Uncharacterized protein n=1 Tax=Tanacetum coccineum TaxID=301880 RepID=A0ABQ4XK90_9ASTR
MVVDPLDDDLMLLDDGGGTTVSQTVCGCDTKEDDDDECTVGGSGGSGGSVLVVADVLMTGYGGTVWSRIPGNEEKDIRYQMKHLPSAHLVAHISG